MRKTIVALAVTSMVLGALSMPAQAGKKTSPRKLKIEYTEPAHGTHGVGVCLQGSSCAFFGDPMLKERFVSVAVEDDLGTDVYASVMQDTNEDGNFLASDDLTVGFCGSTAEPVEIEPNKAVSVWVWQGPGANPPCAGGASSGTITATFN